jgi:glycerophosphoryl diester phosphodiesterase
VLVWSGANSVVVADSRCVPSAHRGDHAHAFENSGEALRAAEGIPYVEIDIRITVDNELVLFHDRRLNSRNVRGGERLIGRPLASLSREELSGLRFPDGSKIARLRTALREVKRDQLTLMLDVKSSSLPDYERILDEVYAAGAESRVVVQCQSTEILAYMRKEFPKVAVLARARAPSEVEMLLGYRPDYVQIDYDWDLSGLVPSIHQRGARVVVKTLDPNTDTPSVWRSVCNAGVDVVLTDKPREFRSAQP